MYFQIEDDKRSDLASNLIGKTRDLLIKAFINEKKRSHITQQQIAEKLGCNRSHVNKILKGETNLTLRTIADFAWAMGYDEVKIDLIRDEVRKGTNYITEAPVQKEAGKWGPRRVDLKAYAEAAE
jgi:transcriptional regulator with XRE-family HTH domain